MLNLVDLHLPKRVWPASSTIPIPTHHVVSDLRCLAVLPSVSVISCNLILGLRNPNPPCLYLVPPWPLHVSEAHPSTCRSLLPMHASASNQTRHSSARPSATYVPLPCPHTLGRLSAPLRLASRLCSHSSKSMHVRHP